jgi:protein-serine/threonine kinase
MSVLSVKERFVHRRNVSDDGRIQEAYDLEAAHFVILKRNRFPGNALSGEMRLTLLNVDHPNIIRCLDSFEEDSSEGSFRWTVLNRISHCDLLSYLERNRINKYIGLPEMTVCFIGRQIVQALLYLHNRDVYHMDVKLENVMVNANQEDDVLPRVTLIDYDLSKFPGDDAVWGGSSHYACPQIFLCRPYTAAKADVFSLGVFLFALICGQFPWGSDRATHYFASDQVNTNPSLVIPNQLKCKPELLEYVQSMLQFDEKLRPTMAEIAKHPLFSQRKQRRRCLVM